MARSVEPHARRLAGTDNVPEPIPVQVRAVHDARLEPALRETYGVIVYQEQVMKIASQLASYSMAEADGLRKAMGKKIMEELEKQRQNFIEGAQKNKISQK